MLVRRAEMAGRIQDLRTRAGRVHEIGDRLVPEPNEEILDAEGGALLPGLHDHHIHLNALAAALGSVDCGPPGCATADAFSKAISTARPNLGWIRGTGYFESVAGPLDRRRLDAIRSDVPIRIQHRSGVMWFLNSAALQALRVDDPAGDGDTPELSPPIEPEAVERDSRGRATGRLFRADRWLRARLPNSAAPDLAPVGRLLARYGVTTVTDATPSNGKEEFAMFRRAQANGALPQSVRMMVAIDERTIRDEADAAHANSTGPALRIDTHKIMLDEPALPELDALIEKIRDAHRRARSVAIHSVTRAEILFALAALEAAGVRTGDRLEHASVAPPEAFDAIARLGLTVVTQPNFVTERGDHYLSHVDARDQPYLYRVQSWLEAGVRLAGGTDAPFGDPDPWRAMQAAVERRTPLGQTLGAAERVSPETALALFQPGFSRSPQPHGLLVPSLEVGDPADGCLLDLPWSEARNALSCERVRATFCGGVIVYRATSPVT